MGKLNTVINLLKDIRKLCYVLLEKNNFKAIPDEIYLKLLYRLRFKEKLNLKQPKTYNEKLQWLKINDRNPEYTNDVDKFAVRKKIEKIISPEVLIPVIGVYDSFDNINFDKLPRKFVIKCTHGTHCSIVCKNKENFDVKDARKKIKKWLKHNYYYDTREWPYKNVRPRILIEKYIEESSGSLTDYKFMCFDGKVKLILVHQDIHNEKGQHTLDIYTPEWKLTDIEWGIPRSGKPIQKPKKLEQCIMISNKLSSGKPHVRVDLYIVDNSIYFGELTYYTAAGFKPFKNKEDDLLLGSWINILEVNHEGNQYHRKQRNTNRNTSRC